MRGSSVRLAAFSCLLLLLSASSLSEPVLPADDMLANTTTTTRSSPFLPGRSIRIPNTGVGSWREISLSRVGAATYERASSPGSQPLRSTATTLLFLSTWFYTGALFS